MRDPKRIYNFCNKLAALWSQVPDWRFGQLICNVLGSELNGRDPFFPEDDQMMGYFEHYFENLSLKGGVIVNNHVAVEEKDSWTPCDEDLPKEEDCYLVAWRPKTGAAGLKGHFYAVAAYDPSLEQWHFDKGAFKKSDVEVLGWQELPPQFKED